MPNYNRILKCLSTWHIDSIACGMTGCTALCCFRQLNANNLHNLNNVSSQITRFKSICYSTISGIENKVGFKHLQIPDDYANNLRQCGIYDLNLSQFITYNTLIKGILANRSHNGLRLVIYNEANTGKTLGYLIPLIYIYSLSNTQNSIHNESWFNSARPSGTLVIVTSSLNDSRKLLSLILSLRPTLDVIIFDNQSSNMNNSSINSDFPYRNDVFVCNNKLIRTHDVIIMSRRKLWDLLESSDGNEIIISRFSTVVFDDLSKGHTNIESNYDIFSKIIKRLRYRPVHIIGITDTLDSSFNKFSKKMLANFILYDLKNGTSKRLISDHHTDALKLEVDIGAVPDVVSAEGVVETMCEHSICKVAKNNRIKILKYMVHLYLDIPTFSISHCIPSHIKRPLPRSKCIIYVSNRRQLKHLVSLPEFSEYCVYLGRDLDIYERSRALSNFKSGIKPVMVATDASIYGCNFEDVKFIFNYHPPKTLDLYKSRFSVAAKNSNSMCITLYDKLQYEDVVTVMKDIRKGISLHVTPTDDYMYRHDLKWLRYYISIFIDNNSNLITPYKDKSNELLLKYSDNVINQCIQIIIGMKTNVLEEDFSVPIYTSSLLTGKSGYTTVILTDVSKQLINDDVGIKKFIDELKVSNIKQFIGQFYKINNGYLLDVNNKYITKFKDIINNYPDISIKIATDIPKIILDTRIASKRPKSKKLPWRSIKSRRMPRINVV